MDIQPLHSMVMGATDGAILGEAVKALPIDTWNTETALNFLAEGEGVYQSLLAVSGQAALDFHRAQQDLLQYVFSGDKDKAARARAKLALAFRLLNGSWKDFQGRFGRTIQEPNVLKNRRAAIARLRDSLIRGASFQKNGVVVKSDAAAGELRAQNVRVTMPAWQSHPKVIQLLDILRSKSQKFIDNYPFVLDNTPTIFFENLADILAGLEKESAWRLKTNTRYDLGQVAEMESFIEAIEATLPSAKRLLPNESRLLDIRLRHHGYQRAQQIFAIIKARAEEARRRLPQSHS